MARLTADQWETIRAEREAGGEGASFPALAAKYGVSHQAIQKRSKAEGWGDGRDINDAINRKVAEKVAGVVAGCNPKKRAEAVAAEVDRRASVLIEHQREWDEIEALRQRVFQALDGEVAVAEPDGDGGTAVLIPVKGAFELAKLAKIMAEQTHIKQAGQRKAYGLEAKDAGTPAGQVTGFRLVPLE